MRPSTWRPPVALSTDEQTIVKLIRRAKLFTWLREHRHELFDEEFQAELAEAYEDSRVGQPAVPPARLALATVVQAYTSTSDDEAIERTVMDRRWQLVLDCLGATHPPFSKGTLVGFRRWLTEHDLDRRLIERTIELAERTRGFSSRRLRAVLDSSPLWGAGRVEDTFNLLGHALRKAVSVLARQQGRGLTEVATEAGAEVVASATSLKAALDEDWDQPEARDHALRVVLKALEGIEAMVSAQPQQDPLVRAELAIAEQVREQDVVENAEGQPSIRQGVAEDRRISVEDPDMRHGRKTRSLRIDGYKRHVLADLDSDLVRGCGVTPANLPEANVGGQIETDLASQGATLRALYMDRAYLNSSLVQNRDAELEIFCKAFPVRNGAKFSKLAFALDWERQEMRCPNDVVLPFRPGEVVHFPAQTCAQCPFN